MTRHDDKATVPMQRLNPARLGDILAVEPKAVALFDDDMRVIGVELPLPDGMTYSDGSRTKTALFGDRVGQDRHGHWLVVPGGPHPTPETNMADQTETAHQLPAEWSPAVRDAFWTAVNAPSYEESAASTLAFAQLLAPAAAAPAVDWIDGHPQLEAIAAAVWEQCGRSDSGLCVEDDPRNIAVAALSAVLAVLPDTGHAAVLREAADRIWALANRTTERGQGVLWAAEWLRRLADETPGAEHVCKPGASVYHCPTSGQTESDCHGGFNVCCDRPELHQPAAGARQDGATP